MCKKKKTRKKQLRLGEFLFQTRLDYKFYWTFMSLSLVFSHDDVTGELTKISRSEEFHFGGSSHT